jgi:hypothetical protein
VDELGNRETKALEELAAHPPAHLAAIGRPDLAGFGDRDAARGSWRAVAAQVMAYRLQYAITDPTRALGASPLRGGGVARETDWRMVIGEIRWSAGNIGEHLIDPGVLPDRGCRVASSGHRMEDIKRADRQMQPCLMGCLARR